MTARSRRHRAPRRALLLDGMGTLVALVAPAPALVAQLRRRCAIEVSEAEAGVALAAEIGFYRAHMALGRDPDALVDLRRRCAAALRAALPRRVAPERLSLAAVTEALLGALRFEAFPDARPLLGAMAADGVATIVVSNWDVSLVEVLELVGLAPLLHGVLTSAAIGAAKPDPAIFEHALALAGVSPERALHVGDSLAEDVGGARAAGIPAVLLDRGGAVGDRVPAGVRVIGDLSELRRAVGP